MVLCRTQSRRRNVPGRGAALVLVLLLAAAGSPRADAPGDDGTRPLWSVPEVATVPVPTTLLQGGEWPEAAAFTGFSELSSGVLSRSQPVVWLARDGQRLYMAWRAPRVKGAPLAQATTERDGPLWNDDSIELFLDPGHTHRDYLQLIINAAGTLYDGRGRDPSWNSDAQVQTAVGAEAWAGVVSLSFASLGVAAPAEDALWAFNAAFDRSPAQRPMTPWGREEAVVTWAPVAATLHEPERFGHLRFVSGGVVQWTGLGQPQWRQLRVTGWLPRGTGHVSLRATEGGTPWQAELTPGGERLNLVPPSVRPGRCQLTFRAAEGERVLALATKPMVVPPRLEPRLQTLAISRKLTVEAALHDPQPPTQLAVGVALRNRQGRAVRTGRLILKQGRTTRPLSWSVADLPAGRYTLRFGEGSGKMLGETAWTLPAKPKWLGSKAGRYGDAHVPRPWTPLKVRSGNQLQVECWGRAHVFGDGGLFRSVRARGKELLAAPAVWRAAVGGKPVSWRAEPTRVRRRAAGAVEFESRLSGSGVRLRCQGRMEFDGFVKLQVEVTGTPGTTLDRLALEIPFRKEVARLLHHFPKPSVWVAVDMERFNARAVPAAGWRSPFVYFVWVGDEARGLQWLCESDEGWRPADPQRAIELVPGQQQTLLRLNVIGKRTRLDRPRRYTFAFQASPVKPTPPDYRRWRYAQVASYGIEKTPHPGLKKDLSVTYPAAGNILPDRGTLEVTLVPHFDSTAPGELNRNVFQLLWPEDRRPEPAAGIWFYWNQDDRGMRVVVREENQYRCIVGAPFAWKPGEVHTVAFTWGEEGAIYVDGQKLTDIGIQGALAPGTDLSQARILLGGRDCDFTVRQLRISDRVRPPETLGVGAAPLTADEFTLLLDRFAEVAPPQGEPRATRPERGTPGTVAIGVPWTADGLQLANPPVTATTLDYLQSLGLRWLGFHEHWTDWQGFPRTRYTQELRSLLAACHQRGMKVALYHSWQLADIAPEFGAYLRECEVIAPDRFLYTRQPKQTDYPICPRSAWADFLADGLQRLFREFGPDGIYSDGLSIPPECSNALHGCGYLGEDGTRHPTVPIFAVREAMKRFARILEQQRKETLFVCHMSGYVTLPSLAFCDAYLDAEHLTGRPRPFRLSLDAFRAEFMGHNFGIPAYFLVYDWHQGMTTTEALAISLLHDTEVPWSFEAMAPVWRIWEQFGVEQARFLPYWQPGSWLRAVPRGVKASLYHKPNGEGLLVAANLSETDVSGTLRLKWPIESARDAFTDEPVSVVDGALTARFPSWQPRLFRVTLR